MAMKLHASGFARTRCIGQQHQFFVKTVKLLTFPRTTTIVSHEPLPYAFAELDAPANEISMELSLRARASFQNGNRKRSLRIALAEVAPAGEHRPHTSGCQRFCESIHLVSSERSIRAGDGFGSNDSND